MDIKAIYNSLPLSPLKEFGDAFTAAKKSAFRLELLDLYTVPSETESFIKYKAGELYPPEDFNKGWMNLLKEAISKGVDHSRVRLVRQPITDYTKFEVSWGYAYSITAGENIRIILYDQLPVFKTPVPIYKDFWMFDETDCYLMEYDLVGQFFGVRKLPPEFLNPYITLKNEAIEMSCDIKSSPLWNYVR